jgi:cysteine-rich repeat protein
MISGGKKLKKVLMLVAVVAMSFAVFGIVNAQITAGLDALSEVSGLPTGNVFIAIANIIRIILGLLGIILVGLIVYAGFLWMTAAGDPKKVETAKKILKNAIIGVIIVLSAFGITQFVLNSLISATEEGGGGVGGGGDVGGGGFGVVNFVLRGITPSGAVPIRNVAVRATFNSEVDGATVAGNFTVTRASDGSAVDGTLTTARNTIEFTPSANCPAPNEDRKCFDADTAYNIRATTNLRNANGQSLVCGGFAPDCNGNFTTGNLVDVSGPSVSVTAPDNGESVSLDSMIILQSLVTDDAGVSQVEFFIDNVFVGADAPGGATPLQFIGVAEWNTTGAVIGKHNITARAYDIDTNTANSSAVSVNVRPAHCFNGIRDADEDGSDCGGEECGACDGSSCVENADCTSGLCRGGICVSSPRIEEVSPNNGKVGNYITISGEFFGTSVGQVVFQGTPSPDDDRNANLAPCSTAWQNDEVVVLVPAGAVDGPIQLCASNGECDTTNNDRGFLIADFDVNTIARPGICGINPRTGLSGDAITISGSQFGATQRKSSAMLGGRDILPTSWGNAEIKGTVPNIGTGKQPVQITVGEEKSNIIYFTTISRDAGTIPSIVAITPASGPREEYVQISGANFGRDIGRVIFRSSASGDEANGLTNFPAQCGNDYWRDDSITIKVPQQYLNSENTANGAYEVRVVRADGAESGSVNFSISDGTAGPGICRLNPDNGPENINIDVYGERFGTSVGQLQFTLNKNATIGSWTDRSITSFVPQGAETGAVSAVVGAKKSNEVNFTVQDCNTSGCSEDEECCASGVCVPEGEVCTGGPRAGGFVWRFSTGIIPTVPRVVEECRENASPSPSPWNKRRGGNSVCINAAVNVRFTVNINRDTLNDENILVYKCSGEAGEPCGDLARIGGLISAYENGFQFIPAGGNFVPLSQYYVYLTTGIQGADIYGEYMAEDAQKCGAGNSYCFGFSTRGGTEPCEVGSVAVDPASYTIKRKNGTAEYLASALDQNDICITLNSNAYDWNWTVTTEKGDPTPKATITNNDLIGGGENGEMPDGNIDAAQTATGLAETVPDPALRVNAEIITEKVSDFGQLIIDFTDPEIISKWPACNTACVNAEIGVLFNTPMNRASIIRSGNFTVLRCVNENCRRFDGALGGAVEYDGENLIATFNHSGLAENTYYRVIIRGGNTGVKSSSGIKLTKTNYGVNNQDYSWVFKTRDSSEPCAISNVNLEPQQAILRFVGETKNYNVAAIGAPDECNPKGQRLVATNYDWLWSSSVLSVADFFTSRGALLDVLPRSETVFGCSNLCLHTGTTPRIPVCGNRSNEKGEDCDDGNTEDGDGCSARCLYEGNALTCGNNLKDSYEDCDDGNTEDGDGCSSICLNEGSSVGGSVCGNGDIGDGEDCDDGNRQNGDGCSDDCLNEGTISGPISFCGNGDIESGEDCDDGNILNGDGCDADCLNEGKNPCAKEGAANCCGNGNIEKGEDCDDGNILNGDGCDSRCLNEGSLVKYGSVCGNGATAADLETGEECEFPNPPSGDRKVDPLQTAVARSGGKTEITASASGVSGAGTLEVMCVCKTDSDCGANISAIGCGNGGCCAARPVVETVTPSNNSTSICRNSVVIVDFSREMDEKSLRENFYLLEPSEGSECPAGTDFMSSQYCKRKGQITIINNDEKTTLMFVPDTALTRDKRYKISILGDANPYDASKTGALSKDGVAMYRNFSSYFTTGAYICTIDKIAMAPGSPISFVDFKTKSARARAISIIGGTEQEIFSIPGVYSWTWSWVNGDENLLRMSGFTPSVRMLTPLIKKGKTRVEAAATITEDSVSSKSSVGKKYSAKTDVIVMICGNPWPARVKNSWSPYIDSSTNFMIYYCRDAGEDGTADDLPDLSIVPTTPPISSIIKEYILRVNCGISSNCKPGDALGIRVSANQEHFSPAMWYKNQGFRGAPIKVEVDGFEAVQDGRTVYVNAVNRAVTGVSPFSFISYYTNIYILSHTQNAGADAQDIFSQIYENIGFAANITDLDLKDSLTRDIRRFSDLREMEEKFRNYAFSHKKCGIFGAVCSSDADCPSGVGCVSVYPLLEAGSYMPRFTNSKWPSWQNGLATELGADIPSDPLNHLGDCNGFDSETCYNAVSRKFLWTAESYVYFYSNCLGNNYNLFYNLEFPEAGWRMSRLYTSSPDYELKFVDPDWEGAEISNYCALTGGVPGGAEIQSKCGNGIKDGSEVCDDGTLNGTYNHCRLDCRGIGLRCGDGKIQRPPIGTEVCDEGSLNGKYGHCSWDCRELVGSYCGDGIINGTEVCDGNVETNNTGCAINPDGYMTQKTRVCRTDCTGWEAWSACLPLGSCGNGIKEGSEQCDDGNLNNADACTNVCKTSYCGDGFVRIGYEQCDMGPLNGVRCTPGPGLSCVYCSSFCSLLTVSAVVASEDEVTGTIEETFETPILPPPPPPSSPPPPSIVCGNGIVETGEDCDRNSETRSCTVLTSITGIGGTVTGYAGTQTRTCSSTCTWNTWGACATTSNCGDGIRQSPEECDDGNAINTDSCVKNCKRAICGDYYVRTGIETCDNGNDLTCTTGSPADPRLCRFPDMTPSTCCKECNWTTTTCYFTRANPECSSTITINCCGNRRVEGGEQCDDGNYTRGDGCYYCIVERCGNGRVEGAEQCDDGNIVETDGCTTRCTKL